MSKIIVFSCGFSTFFENSIFVPKTARKSISVPQGPAKSTQEPPKSGQDGPKSGQDRPESSLRPPQERPKTSQDRDTRKEPKRSQKISQKSRTPTHMRARRGLQKKSASPWPAAPATRSLPQTPSLVSDPPDYPYNVHRLKALPVIRRPSGHLGVRGSPLVPGEVCFPPPLFLSPRGGGNRRIRRGG